MARTRSKGFSYSAGERGRNRVRAYERPGWGHVMLEYYVPDTVGRLRRTRVSLGRCTREVAKAKADELAAQFRTAVARADVGPVTLRSLFDIYEREVTPEKGESTQRHDHRCREMFLRFFGVNRDPKTLSRREWDRFVADRRRGTIAPKGVDKARRVRERVVGYDLKYLLAVLNWATRASDGYGGTLLDRNPLKGLPIPKEESPQRATVTAEQYVKLRKAARAHGPLAGLLLVLCHETGHRVGSIRQLRWSDIDLEGKTIHWRGELDKLRLEHTTPLSDEAVKVLTRVRRELATIGHVLVFPSPEDLGRPWSRFYVRSQWDKLATAAKLPIGKRYGWHAFRRQFASELKPIPLKDLCHLGGWKSAQTILTCYQSPDEATQRTALAQRKRLTATGLK